MRLLLEWIYTEARVCWRIVGPWALVLQLLLPAVAWLQEPAFLQSADVGMVESAALGAACGVALGTPWIWVLARWGGAQRGAFRVPPATYGIAVTLGIALFLFCNLLAGIGLLFLLGRPLEPTSLGPLVGAGLSGGCLLALPLAPWLPLVVGLRLHAAWRVALMLALTAVLAAGFCPNPAAVSAQDGAMMGELLLASVGSIALLAAIQPPRSSPEPLHAHRHPR